MIFNKFIQPSIKVNGDSVDLLQQCDDVYSLEVTHQPGVQIPIQPGNRERIMTWLYDLAERAKNRITYNGTILTLDQLINPKGK